jgi:hypothetical protein
MARNEVDQVDKMIEKVKLTGLKVADAIPLPLHYVANAGLIFVFLVSWLWPGDPIPFVDEILTAAGVYYYNAYLLKRTFGALNPVRIFRGETPVAKRRLGLLPYEQYLERINARLKAMRKDAKKSEVPGLNLPKIEKLGREIQAIEKRLRILDRLLIRPEFQEGVVRTQIAQIQARIGSVNDEAVKMEFARAIEHALAHVANIERLRDERNRLVARLERFSLQLDQIYSHLVAMSVEDRQQIAEAERQFDELFTAITSFDQTLQELEAQPSSDLYQAAIKEVADTEERVKISTPQREGERTI